MTVKTGDPRFPIRTSAELTRYAREGMVAEWDCITFGSAAVMTDLTGNGHDMTFTATPTKTARGITFNGTYWGDATLPVLGNNYTFFLVHMMPFTGFNAFGNRNDTAAKGARIVPYPGAGIGSKLLSGDAANESFGPVGSSTTWTAQIAKIYEDTQGRTKGLTQGILGYQHTLRGNTALDDRTLWRLGSGIVNATDSVNPMPSGEAAYLGVFNRITSERQDAALLAYLKTIMAARGLTISL